MEVFILFHELGSDNQIYGVFESLEKAKGYRWNDFLKNEKFNWVDVESSYYKYQVSRFRLEGYGNYPYYRIEKRIVE